MAEGIIIFAHGSGSGRFSPRNQFVAEMLVKGGFATLLLDLLTEKEEEKDSLTYEYRFDISLLAGRLLGATEWVKQEEGIKDLLIGYFGASTGAAAALIAAAKRPDLIRVVVSRGGRPDLGDRFLPLVKAPTLLIVGGNDTSVIELNKEAYEKLVSMKKLAIVPRATHLFEESGALEKVGELALNWFLEKMVSFF